jgi:hypothetical protein
MGGGGGGESLGDIRQIEYKNITSQNLSSFLRKY